MLLTSASLITNRYLKIHQILSLMLLTFLLLVGLGSAQTNVLKYLELSDVGATPAEILLSPDFQTILEFEGMVVQSVSSGRADKFTAETDGSTVRLRANEDVVNTDLTVVVAGRTALFILKSDPSSNTPRRYVVRNSPPPALAPLSYQGVEGKANLDALAIGTRDLPPGVTLDVNAKMDNKGNVTLQYTLANDGEVAIVNEPSRLHILNEEIKLRHTQSRVPPAASANVIQPGQSESGTIVVTNPPNGQLTFLWVLVQLGPGGHYSAVVDITALLEAPVGTTATLGTPAPAEAPAATPQTAVSSTVGVTLYEHADFSGASVALAGTESISFYNADQGQFGAVPNNSVSSLVVSEGYIVLLCDAQATFPCEQYGAGSHGVAPELNDKFSFAQVSVLPVMETTTTAIPVPAQESNQQNLIVNGSFDAVDEEANPDNWWIWADMDAGAKVQQAKVTDGRYCAVIEAGERHAIVLGQTRLTLEPNLSYTLSFDYQADRVAGLVVAYQKSIGPWTYYFRQDINADAGVQHFEGSFTSAVADPTTRLIFHLGGNEAGTTICLDNIVLTATPALATRSSTTESSGTASPDTASSATGQTVLLEAMFESSDENEFWALWSNKGQNAQGRGEIVDGQYCVSIEEGGDNTWGIQFASLTDLNLQAGRSYTVAFDARADSVNGVVARVIPFVEPFRGGYFEERLEVDAGTQHFEYTFVMSESREKMRLNFMLGGELSQGPNHVCFDNITFTSQQSATPVTVGTSLLNETFEAGSQVWGLWVDTELGAEAHGDMKDGSYCVSIEKSGAEVWNIIFNSPYSLALEAGRSYTLSFNAKSDRVNKLALSVSENFEPHYNYVYKDFQIDVSDQQFSQTFTAAKSSADIRISFHMGAEMVSTPTSMCFDNISLQDVTPSTSAQTTQPTETTATTSLTGTYALAATHSGLCLDVLRFSEEDGAPIAQWTCNDEINQRWTLEPRGEYYRIRAEHSKKCLDVSEATPDTIHQWECHEEDNQLWSLKQVAQGYQLVSKQSGKCLAGTDASVEAGAGLVERTCSEGTEVSHDVFALNPAEPAPDVPVADANPAPSGENLLVNSGFDEIGAKGWTPIVTDGAKGVTKVINSEYCLNMINGGPNPWNTRLHQSIFEPEPGQPYILSFDAHANEPRTIVAVVGEFYEPWEPRVQRTYTLQTQKQTYYLPFVMNATEDDISFIDFYMGGELATNPPFQICFDNVTLQKGTLSPEQLATANTGNILGNSSFDDATGSSWQTWVRGDTEAKAIGEIRNGEYCVYVENGGDGQTNIQFFQHPFLLEAGQDYTLSFDAYTDQPHSLMVYIGQGYEPWEPYIEQPFDIGAEKQTYTTTFNVKTREPNSGIEFWLGSEYASDLPAQTCFDNIIIKESSVTAAQ